MLIREYIGKSLLFAIASSYDTVWRDFNARLRKEHCGFLEAMILIALFFEARKGSEKSLRPGALAAAFGTTRANLSHGITRLEKAGLLKRALVESDARGYELALKPEGRRVALRLIEAVDRLENHFERQLGAKEVERTITQLRRLSEIYQEYLNSF